MHIKRYTGQTTLEAVQRVKAELGSEALILEVRRVRGEGVFGRLGRSLFEVVAAVDRDPTPTEAPEPRVAPDASWDELRLSRALLDPLTDELRRLRREVEILRRAGGAPTGDIAASAPEPGLGPCDSPVRRAAAALVARGLAPSLAHDIASDGSADPVAGVAARLEQRLDVSRSDTGPPIELFVGPSGVGKTTTLAKVASRQDQEEAEVAIVTTDTLRIGGEVQLRAFAGLLGIDFGVAPTPEELARRVDGRSGGRLLVDSAGRRSSDPDAMAALHDLRDSLGDGARVHLVLSATTREADLQAEVARYRSLRPDSLILTKLDECGGIGDAMNVVLAPDTPPLRWVTDGQRVPEDLAIPDPTALADRLLGATAGAGAVA